MARDAVVVGSGPNGLAAAITLAEAGRRVRVIEGAETVGGGLRSSGLTLPGFSHDVCSAIHPFAVASPFFSSRKFHDHGLEWVQPEIAVSHPLDDGTAVAVHRSIEATVDALGSDGPGYRRLVESTVKNWDRLIDHLLGPILRFSHHPAAMARFGVPAVAPITRLTALARLGERGSALMGGIAAHGVLPLDAAGTGSFAIILAAAGHVVGWPLPRRGSQSIADAMTRLLGDLGGEIETGAWVRSMDDLPAGVDVLFDVAPPRLLEIVGERLPPGYRSRLGRFRHGPGAFKVDYALSGPVPWAAEECHRSATVHLGGSIEAVARSEALVAAGEHPDQPFVIVAQPSLFDDTRAPEGQHTLWAYCHVPSGSSFDMADRIEAQIERFAPGFQRLVLARHIITPTEFESYNPNYVGGDITGGQQHLTGLLARPVFSTDPYATPADGIYLCSASTPPGGGVHGMCGYHAARSLLRRTSRIDG
jgi:phytoene dehydrogenase-like protein